MLSWHFHNSCFTYSYLFGLLKVCKFKNLEFLIRAPKVPVLSMFSGQEQGQSFVCHYVLSTEYLTHTRLSFNICGQRKNFLKNLVSSEFFPALLCYHRQARTCPKSVSGPELRVKSSGTLGENP